jgi:TPP-dependent pyruvate/acetoin dehydrogenase alpha subunit
MTPELAHSMLFQMKRIRHVEEQIAARYSENKMRCPTHLSIGQEGVAAGVGAALRQSDFAVSGHRAHAHYLAKGGSLKAMLAEIYGKETGCSKGKGGSMHLIDEFVGFMGSTAIVGGTVPVGVGLGYSIKLKNTDQVSCIFLGDAVVETGVFFESINFAILKNLPVLFVCENNLYSVYSPMEVRQPGGRSIANMVSGLGIETVTADGNNVSDVYEITLSAVNSIRKHQKPKFIEFSTYRWLEHCGPNYDNDLGYRSIEEFELWREKEPISAFLKKVLDNKLIDNSNIISIDEKIKLEIEDAFNFAELSKFPPQDQAFSDLYSS